MVGSGVLEGGGSVGGRVVVEDEEEGDGVLEGGRRGTLHLGIPPTREQTCPVADVVNYHNQSGFVPNRYIKAQDSRQQKVSPGHATSVSTTQPMTSSLQVCPVGQHPPLEQE